jgi:hypothetical protein
MTGGNREEQAIADLRAWLTTNVTTTLPPPARLASRFELSLVFVISEIKAARQQIARQQAALPVNPSAVATAPPDRSTAGEDDLTEYLDTGQVNSEVDTVRALAYQFDLSLVYVREQLTQRQISLPESRRRSPSGSVPTNPVRRFRG